MKAISIRQPYASDIICEDKRIEYRIWQTKHRGDMLICAATKIAEEYSDMNGDYPQGYAIGVVELYEIKKNKNGFSWLLKNPRAVVPFKVKGKQKLFDVDDDLINIVDLDSDSIWSMWLEMNLIE